ncbi:MAG: ABC transporter permease subunit [Kiloniellaceae bacterium]|nr:ABC transporter permease subunit [Kiloniellaceae bacterium]
MSVAGQVTEQTFEMVHADTAALSLRERISLTARQNRFATVGLAILVLVLTLAFALPLFYTTDPLVPQAGSVLEPPGAGHPLGTDSVGRDVLARLIDAAQLDFLIAFAVTTLAFGIGSVVGAIAGFVGRLVDDLVMRVVDVMLSFPAFILALAVTVMLGNEIRYVIAALAFAYMPFFVRLTRGEVLKIRDSDYADAARVVGNPAWRVAFRHVFPNSVAPAVVLGPIVLGWSILDAAALGFLGIGIRPPTSEWGVMVAEGAQNVASGEWWTWLFPGLVILVVVLAFNWIGDGLRNLVRSA